MSLFSRASSACFAFSKNLIQYALKHSNGISARYTISIWVTHTHTRAHRENVCTFTHYSLTEVTFFVIRRQMRMNLLVCCYLFMQFAIIFINCIFHLRVLHLQTVHMCSPYLVSPSPQPSVTLHSFHHHKNLRFRIERRKTKTKTTTNFNLENSSCAILFLLLLVL